MYSVCQQFPRTGHGHWDSLHPRSRFAGVEAQSNHFSEFPAAARNVKISLNGICLALNTRLRRGNRAKLQSFTHSSAAPSLVLRGGLWGMEKFA